MPNPKALRAAIAQHAPKLLVDFDRRWRRDITDAYALARNPQLEARVHGLEDQAAEEPDFARAKVMIEEAGQLRREAAKAEPGQ
ncbi:hypothetical protein [Streptomyces sp. NPDC048191]|uniref:hypothetical protein n=1 Tax=Streptomyces sp. NPDC048191 TaxID=3155484 RepID=UPI0033C44D18